MSTSLAAQGLNDRQISFVRALVETGNRTLAAEMAGYATPNTSATKLLSSAPVIAAIRLEMARRLQAIAPVALGVLLEIATDATAPKSARVDASKTLLDRAGYVAPKGESDRRDLNLADMPVAELYHYLSHLKGELETRQRAGNAPVTTVHEAQLAELLD